MERQAAGSYKLRMDWNRHEAYYTQHCHSILVNQHVCLPVQAAKLYAEEGQINPHEARAQRKQQKKSRRRTVSTAGKGSAASDEYDFAEAFHSVNVGSDED